MSLVDSQQVLLQPRKYAKSPGSLILIPLLLQKRPAKTLPTELWIKILGYVFAGYYTQSAQSSPQSIAALRQSLLLVCKHLRDIALPLYYQHAVFTSPSSLKAFTSRLEAADKQWDSIRRIPYSAPGRWVQVLDLGDLRCTLWSQVCYVDEILTRLFPLLPFLAHLTLNDTLILSRRVIDSLCNRDGNERLKSIKGLKLVSASVDHDDPFLGLLQCCPNLEQLEFTGSGIEPLLIDSPDSIRDMRHIQPKSIHLPLLRKLSMVAMHCSPVMFALLHSSLPSLSHLTVTPYDDTAISTSLVPQFIDTHGAKLSSLHLFAPKSWPTMLFQSPANLLHSCPNLYHLSLENPLPILTIPSTLDKHPLHILSIPRPIPEFLLVLEPLFARLPNLQIIRSRDVQWLRTGMSPRAMEAGVQGELRQWRQRLARKGVNVVDSTWSAPTA